jgi:hypothetical protein
MGKPKLIFLAPTSNTTQHRTLTSNPKTKATMQSMAKPLNKKVAFPTKLKQKASKKQKVRIDW